MAELNENIKSAIKVECDCPRANERLSHCHEINNFDISRAIAKIKSDKISDNGLVYSNNFIYRTNLLHKCLSILFTSMIYHVFAPQTFICAQIIPIPKGSKATLTCSDKYRNIANSNVIGKILDHVIIDRQSECLKTCDYQFGFKPKSSTVLCSTMVNETIQYYTEMVVVLSICYSLMLPRHLTKSLLKYCLMYCWTKMYVLELFIYCTILY